MSVVVTRATTPVNGTQVAVTGASLEEDSAVEITNLGPDHDIFVGPNGVTTANGYPIKPGCRLNLNASGETQLFACTMAGKSSQVASIVTSNTGA
jgi:hypothetical protein